MVSSGYARMFDDSSLKSSEATNPGTLTGYHADAREWKAKIGGGDVRIRTTRSTVPNWLKDGLVRLNRISELPLGWDSYSAQPVSQPTLEHALSILIQIMEMKTMPLPRINATASGGVEFIWENASAILEIEVEGAFRASAYFQDDNAEEEQEDIGVELKKLEPYLGAFS